MPHDPVPPPRLRTRLTERLGLVHPVLSAPMAHIAGGRLAAAVSGAGGLGLIGGGYGEDIWLEHQFELAGRARVGCGFIVWSLARRPFLLDLALDRFPAAILLAYGDPALFADRIRGDGVALICQVHSLDGARAALDAGADVIVAQGAEAGGHGLARATMTLVPEVADLMAARAPDTPLVAAGGIADGRGLAAALMLGADGVLMGSRFLASREALVHPALQAAALAAGGDASVRSALPDRLAGRPWPGGFTARVLRNRLTEAGEDGAGEPDPGRCRDAIEAGDADMAALPLGEAAGLIGDIAPAGEIVRRTVAEACALLAGRAGAFVATE